MRSLRLPVFPPSLYLVQTHPVASIPVPDSHQHGPHSRTLILWPDILTDLEYGLSYRSLCDAAVGVSFAASKSSSDTRTPTDACISQSIFIRMIFRLILSLLKHESGIVVVTLLL